MDRGKWQQASVAPQVVDGYVPVATAFVAVESDYECVSVATASVAAEANSCCVSSSSLFDSLTAML